jgi:type I restriction enzyme S subunit
MTTIKLRDATVKVGSGATPRGGSSVYVKEGVTFIRSQNVLDNAMKLDDIARISDDAADALRGVIVQRGDVLLNITGDSIARCCVVDDAVLPARVSQHVAIIRPNHQLDGRYLQRVLVSPSVKDHLLNISSGGTRKALTKSMIEDLDVPLIPLVEQRRIADVLGAMDAKIVVNERLARTAFELADSLFLDVMRSTDNRKPERVRIRFGDLGKLFDGPHATPTRCAAGPYFLNISSLKSGRLDIAESDHVSESDFLAWTRRVTPQAGDLLFSYETRLGEAALMPGGVRACLGRRMALLRPDRHRVDPDFLLHYYLSPTFQRIIAARTVHGATVPRIGLATMGDWEIEIPPLHEQEVVAGSLRSLHEAMVQAERETARLASVRDELLPPLMSGKIQIKDAVAIASEAL